jgi:hypothetical protein
MGRQGADFPTVDFTWIEGKYPVTLRSINIFERVNAHLNIGVTVVQYETEFEDGARSPMKWVLFPVRGPSIELVKH